MRTNILFLSAILASGIILSSCGDKGKTEGSTIVGEWGFKDLTFDIKTSDPEATAKIMSFYTKNNDEDESLSVEFTNDGRMIGSNGELRTYSISENEITTNFENMSGKNEFRIKGDTLSIIEDISGMFNNKTSREMVGINDSVKVEKAIVAMNLVRKK